MRLVITSAVSGIFHASISPDLKLFAALPLLLVIGVLYAIVVAHYLRQKDNRHTRKRKQGDDIDVENAPKE